MEIEFFISDCLCFFASLFAQVFPYQYTSVRLFLLEIENLADLKNADVF